MNVYIEVGKLSKNGKEKPLVTAFINAKTGGFDLGEDIKSKKQRLKIVEALLDLAYEIEAETAESKQLGESFNDNWS